MRIKIRAHMRKNGNKRFRVRRHFRAFKKKQNIGQKAASRYFTDIPKIENIDKTIFHKSNISNCPRCGAILSKRGQCFQCSKALVEENYSSFTALGPVSESLDKAERQFRQKKIRETRKLEKMPIDTLIEFMEREKIKESLGKNLEKEGNLLKDLRKRLKSTE